MENNSYFDGKLVIATCAPGTRDFIYVGIAKRMGDRLLLTGASMVLRYEEVGVPGISSQPEKAVRLRPITANNGTIDMPMESTLIMEADAKVWEEYLGKSIG